MTVIFSIIKETIARKNEEITIQVFGLAIALFMINAILQFRWMVAPSFTL